MISEQVDKLKADYTDKYVVVDSERPELARFAGYVGQVKTVNMSGRALVEFHEYLENIGWYDIELDYLRVVDKPEPKKEPAKKQPVAKKAPPSKPQDSGAKKLSPLEMARMQGPAKKKEARQQTAKKMSVDDILAAARSETRSQKTPPAEEAAEPAPAESPTAEPAAKPDRSKMSVDDILAAARAEKGRAPADAPATPSPADDSDDAPSPAEEQAAAEGNTAAESTSESPANSGDPVDRSSMSVDDILAWCREHDAGS